ncbi:MAG: response regulator receiver protein [Acidobacteriaceae bacterium]|nr:response regulator receiver protein [Acidobacteriaceae bacterium]
MAQPKTAQSPVPKPATRVALLDLDEADAKLLTDCFKQFNVKTTTLHGDEKSRLAKEKLEGCVLRLDDSAGSVLEAARNSPSNRRMLIYGIAADPKIAMRYSRYCINAIFPDPLERSAALKVVRATYLLALHEYRRYVRIPLAVEVVLSTDGHRVTTLSEEISSGGMSLRAHELMHGKIKVQAKFVLPEAQDVDITASICWRREAGSMIGIRFDSEHKSRQLVQKWVDDFLQF